MTNMLPTLLATATGPSRTLDCLVHEFITGNKDLQPEANKALARSYGHMLLDLGSERLQVTAPDYTTNPATVLDVFPKRLGLRITIVPPQTLKHAETCPNCAELHVGKYMPALWDTDSHELIAESAHNTSLALALCCLLVTWKIGK